MVPVLCSDGSKQSRTFPAAENKYAGDGMASSMSGKRGSRPSICARGPKIISVVEARWLGEWRHRRGSQAENRCQLHYSQPRNAPGFLALKYIFSTAGTSYATFRGALVVLDEIARLKNAAAIVTDVSNLRISDRLLRRHGWEPHLDHARQRHFIKRFYDGYPDHASAAILCANRSTRALTWTTNPSHA